MTHGEARAAKMSKTFPKTELWAPTPSLTSTFHFKYHLQTILLLLLLLFFNSCLHIYVALLQLPGSWDPSLRLWWIWWNHSSSSSWRQMFGPNFLPSLPSFMVEPEELVLLWRHWSEYVCSYLSATKRPEHGSDAFYKKIKKKNRRLLKRLWEEDAHQVSFCYLVTEANK